MKKHIILPALVVRWMLLVGALFGAQQATAGYAMFTQTTVTVEDEWLDDSIAFQIDLRPEKAIGTAPSKELYAGPRFGPFRVIAQDMVELNGLIDSNAPQQFKRLIAQFPAIRMLKMTECEGTVDDEANMALARLIRARGIATWVPDNGSVRSGGVELFFAGSMRYADRGAQFAVHSWQDEDGYEASDYPPSDPVHKLYIQYYLEMGMTVRHAHEFYDLTNSVSNDQALWLNRDRIAQYIPLTAYLS